MRSMASMPEASTTSLPRACRARFPQAMLEHGRLRDGPAAVEPKPSPAVLVLHLERQGILSFTPRSMLAVVNGGDAPLHIAEGARPVHWKR